MHTPITEPTADEMQEAWRRMHKPDWPPLDEIMASARRYQLLRGAALRLARGERAQPEAPTQQATPASAARAPAQACTSLHVPKQPPMLDRKSAAAGEREIQDQ